jgi:hypothetical protein
LDSAPSRLRAQYPIEADGTIGCPRGDDGDHLRPLRELLSAEALGPARALVVVNAKGPTGHDPESAFSPREIDAVVEWVRAGGGLLLVADHTLFGSAAGDLSRRFGVAMMDGEVQDLEHADLSSGDPAQLVFDRAQGLLGAHPILEGRALDERVSRVVTFTGQSLAAPPGADRLLLLAPTAQDLPVLKVEMIETLFDWDRRTTFGDPIPTRGNCQAVALSWGQGRVVVAGEAALFSAQVRAGRRFGFTEPPGTQNEQFVLNAVRWLGGALDIEPVPAEVR